MSLVNTLPTELHCTYEAVRMCILTEYRAVHDTFTISLRADETRCVRSDGVTA